MGVLKEEGDSAFNFINFDEVVWIPYNTARRFLNVGKKSRIGRMLNIKANEGVDLEDLKGETTGILRGHRRLKPTEDDNFALNELSALTSVLDNVFGVLNGVGIVIGGFSLIVGMFSVANIMFVSVKERTNIIGIKKALGAKKSIILLEFLIEAIILCIIGGAIGILLVYILILVATHVFDLMMSLTFGNLMLGFIVSIIVGIISGIIPAYLAARLDPVEAMRG